MDGKGIRAWSRRNRRVAKVSLRVVKEFKGVEVRIVGSEGI